MIRFLKEFQIIYFFILVTINISAQDAFNQSNYDVKFYHLDVILTDTSTYISGKATIHAFILSTNDSLFLDLGNQLHVHRVLVEDNPVNFFHSGDKLLILSDLFISDSLVSINVEYEGDGNDEDSDGALFNKENEPYGTFTYSLTEPYSTKYWYPCKEVLTDKADSVYVYITVPNHLKAGSNGILKEVVYIDDIHVQYRWESNYPTAFYLISVAIGNYIDYTIYTDISNSSKPLPIVNYIYNSDEYLNQQKQNIDTTAYLINFLAEVLCPYPFPEEKYGHCLAPLGGGMEHQTMTTLGSFGYNLVVHELAHQWFGNLVTCDSWNHIWINEGFASYVEYLAHELSGDLIGAQDWIEHAQNAALNSTVGSVYVPDDELELSSRIFNYNSTYKKGAAIIHMLRYEIDNDSVFFEAIREFLNRFAFSNASADDFLSIVNELSGRDFIYFFNQWYYGSGYPIVDIEWYQVDDVLTIKTIQTTSEPSQTPFFDLTIQYKIIFPTGDSIINVRLSEPVSEFKLQVKHPVVKLQVDPNSYLIKEVSSINTNDSLMPRTGNRMHIYPNPAFESIKVYSRVHVEPIDIYFHNLSGIEIKIIRDVNPRGTEISINGLETGIYLITLDLGDKTEIVKLIKS